MIIKNKNILGIIYIAISSTTQKVYIGQTIQTLYKRKQRHINNAHNCSKKNNAYNTHFSCAIRKYGMKDFDWYIIKENILKTDLSEMEIKYISLYDSFNYGYNSTPGGEHYAQSQETKNKISKSLKGRRLSKDTCSKMSKARKGKKHTKESIVKMSKAQSNKIISDDQKLKISKAHIGTTHSKETRNKISKSQLGKTLSNEHKRNMSKPNLKWKTVREIRSKYKTNNYTQNELAILYGVGKSTVRRIVNNLSWIE